MFFLFRAWKYNGAVYYDIVFNIIFPIFKSSSKVTNLLIAAYCGNYMVNRLFHSSKCIGHYTYDK